MNQKQFLNNLKQLPEKFKSLSLEEKLAYGAIALGIILLLIALFLF